MKGPNSKIALAISQLHSVHNCFRRWCFDCVFSFWQNFCTICALFLLKFTTISRHHCNYHQEKACKSSWARGKAQGLAKSLWSCEEVSFRWPDSWSFCRGSSSTRTHQRPSSKLLQAGRERARARRWLVRGILQPEWRTADHDSIRLMCCLQFLLTKYFYI